MVTVAAPIPVYKLVHAVPSKLIRLVHDPTFPPTYQWVYTFRDMLVGQATLDLLGLFLGTVLKLLGAFRSSRIEQRY